MAVRYQPLSGQGTVFVPDVSDEQGAIYACPDPLDLNKDVSIDIDPKMKRFPSFSDFDKEEALIHSFGLVKKQLSSINIVPESEQLGVIIDDEEQNELERLSYESDEGPEEFWLNTDNINPNSIVMDFEKELNCQTFSGHIKAPLVKIPAAAGDQSYNYEEDKTPFNDSSNHGSESVDDKSSSKEIRWRKEDDKKLFSAYRNLWRQSMLNLRDVLSQPLRKNKDHKALMEEVARRVGWKGKLSMLLRRLKKILNDNWLSVREKQDLTRMFKTQAKEGKLDWESILKEFPGKNLIYIKEFWKDIKVKVHPDLPAIKSETFDFEEEITKLMRKKRRNKIQPQDSAMLIG